MFQYLIRRLIGAVGVIFGVATITFIMVFLMPGDAARMYAGPRAPEETVQRIRELWGLDQPLPVQYVRYLARAAQGDLGRSTRDNRPVLQAVFERLPATLQLAVAGLFVELAIGIPLGIVAALKRNSWIDNLATVFGLVGISIPPFALGLVALYVFGFLIPIFPLGGYGTPLHLVLPALILGFGGAAFYARVLRNNLLEVMGEDYIRTARAKGLAPSVVLRRHILRNALLPTVTLAGLDLALLLGGVVVIEAVFGWPGIGLQAFNAIRNQDTPIIMGTVLFASTAVVFINLAVDFLYVTLDPRVRVS
ncbi:MAG TPA: ABC transporter permease [Aggregatilineales bacterium]|nr:ABC transporter permease [Anaerolineae bacterium]HUN09319.1 ABC transporter permease [Aggregatilineales bacterium]